MYARKGEGASDRVFLGLYPSPERFGLRVTAAKPSYLLAMKLRAFERVTADDRDFEDAIKLAIECGVSTVDELRNIVGKFFADETLPHAAQLRFGELAEAIRARSG
jgi:hypothetical protein